MELVPLLTLIVLMLPCNASSINYFFKQDITVSCPDAGQTSHLTALKARTEAAFGGLCGGLFCGQM